MRTGPVVTLEVAKQGAIYHGLATLLQQPSPVITRGMLGNIVNSKIVLISKEFQNNSKEYLMKI